MENDKTEMALKAFNQVLEELELSFNKSLDKIGNRLDALSAKLIHLEASVKRGNPSPDLESLDYLSDLGDPNSYKD